MHFARRTLKAYHWETQTMHTNGNILQWAPVLRSIRASAFGQAKMFLELHTDERGTFADEAWRQGVRRLDQTMYPRRNTQHCVALALE